MLDGRLFVPSGNLQCELCEQLHVVNASENRCVYVERKCHVGEFFNAVILAAKILVICAGSVVGGTEVGGDFDDVGSAKHDGAYLEGLQNFKSRGLISMLVIREEVNNDGVWDGVDDVKDTHKIGVSIVRVVWGGLVVLGLSVVNLGNGFGDRRLKYTR